MDRRRDPATLVDDLGHGDPVRGAAGVERGDGTDGVGLERAEPSPLMIGRESFDEREDRFRGLLAVRDDEQGSVPLDGVAQPADTSRQVRAGGVQVVDDHQERARHRNLREISARSSGLALEAT